MEKNKTKNNNSNPKNLGSKPLDNIKHELFAQKLIENKGQITKSYLDVYDGRSIKGASANANLLLNKNESVKERVRFLLDKNNLSLDNLSIKLNKFTNSDNEGIGLDATKFAFKLHGVLDDNNSDNQIETINIIFGDVHSSNENILKVETSQSKSSNDKSSNES